MSVPLSNKSSHFSFVNGFLHGITEFLSLFNQPCLINKWQTCVKAIYIAFTYICWFFWLPFLFKYIWCLIKEYFESVCRPFTNWLSNWWWKTLMNCNLWDCLFFSWMFLHIQQLFCNCTPLFKSMQMEWISISGRKSFPVYTGCNIPKLCAINIYLNLFSSWYFVHTHVIC